MLTLDDCRLFYAEEIRFAVGVNSPALLEAFARVPREKFLGPRPWQIGSPEQRALSLAGMGSLSYTPTDDPRHLYHNVVVALDAARDVNNGQPSALARWIEALDLKAGDRVYHLGCGVSCYTAIIAEVVGLRGSVVAAEVLADLAALARENLSRYPNVTVHAADGASFDPDACAAMLINAGVTHPHPLWLNRLREGGRLVLPVTMATSATLGTGVMVRIVRQRGGFSAQVVTFVGIYSCTSVRDPELEPLVKKALTTGALLNLASARRDPHEPVDTCLLHGREVCLSSADPAGLAMSPRPDRSVCRRKSEFL
jgi:protein-L-isoaspartate(D-aspartate) O-methyltransferase